jgi:hypothetical protein
MNFVQYGITKGVRMMSFKVFPMLSTAFLYSVHFDFTPTETLVLFPPTAVLVANGLINPSPLHHHHQEPLARTVRERMQNRAPEETGDV